MSGTKNLTLFLLAEKTRFGGKKQFFLSPDEQMLPCRRKALEMLIKEGGEEEVEEMKSFCIKYEGF